MNYLDDYELYEDNIFTFVSLADINQPYSCSAWANLAPNGSGDIVHDTGYGIFNLFNSQNGFPSFIFIDHTMTVYFKSNSAGTYSTKLKIEEMLEACIADGLCGSVDFDNDGIIEGDNCPNDYNPDQEDGDYDEIGDACDDCLNNTGDVNDDYIIDILDIVNVVNMVLTGGLNSPNFTDCALSDADMTGDGTINILDVIQIINAVLGNLNRSVELADSKEYVEIEAIKKNGNLYLTVQSEYAAGLEINFNDFVADVNLIDDKGYLTLDKLDNNIDKCLVYSLTNKEFNNESFTLEIEDGAKLDCNKITAVAGDKEGSNMRVRFASPEVRNFAINSLYPNPFNPVTSIDYSVEKAGNLRLSVYNILGQEVAVLYNGYQTEGESFSIKWDAHSFSSGVYFVHMVMNGQVETMKAMVVK